MRICQWVPAYDSPRWSVILSWMGVRMKDNRPEGCDEIRFLRTLTESDEKLRPWNEAVKKFLDTGDDWLFMTHNDVMFDPGTLKRLLSWDKPLVSALLFMRQAPVIPHIWKSYETDGRLAHRIQDTREWFLDRPEWIKFGPFIIEPRPEDALVEVGFTSTACTMVRREILEKMGEPWFTQDGYLAGGEDRKFFEKALAVGYQGYVDRSCVAGHIVGDVPTSNIDFMMWSQASEFRNTGEPGTEAPQ